MKKAKDGATKRLRIASCMCLLFMIVEFVGKNPVLFSLIYMENGACHKTILVLLVIFTNARWLKYHKISQYS